MLERLSWNGWLNVGESILGYRFNMTYFSARINSILFSSLWNCAPILVSVVSFFAYVMSGNELTVSVAFTVCLILFWSYNTQNGTQ